MTLKRTWNNTGVREQFPVIHWIGLFIPSLEGLGSIEGMNRLMSCCYRYPVEIILTTGSFVPITEVSQWFPI